MFKLRHRSDRSSGDRIEFKLSNFQAFKVPRGWDKLFLSVVSVESGKTIAKSSKASVYGGTCQWTEAFSESIRVHQDDASKGIQESHKIIVTVGSARSGSLGEIILNLVDYMSSRDSGALSLPLKKCIHGTILQIRIQCHTPRTTIRDQKSSKETTYNHGHLQSNHEDMDKSDGSDNILNKGMESSFSASGSHRSSDSGGSPIGRANFSPINSLNGGTHIGRLDSTGSYISTTCSFGPSDDFPRSSQSSFNSRASGSSIHTNQLSETASRTPSHSIIAQVSLRSSDSSKDLLEDAEEAIDELRDEAKMWERHSRKLKLDIETLKRENSVKFKHQTELEAELSAVGAERDSLKKEIEQLKSALEELMRKQTITGTAKIAEMLQLQNELEAELKFQKEVNANSNLQLKKTQEANIELVSILQDLEELVERQKMEITNLSQNQHVVEHGDNFRSQILRDTEAEWETKLSVKEEEISKLEKKLSAILNTEHGGELVCNGGNLAETKETTELNAKIQELERDCAELTDENLELIFKLKEAGEDIREGKTSYSSVFVDSNCHVSHSNSDFETGLLKSQIKELEEELKQKELLSKDLTSPLITQIKCLEEKCADLELELQNLKEQSSNLDSQLRQSQIELKDQTLEFSKVQGKLETYPETLSGCSCTFNQSNLEEVEACCNSEMSRTLYEINKQLHIALVHLTNRSFGSAQDATTECLDDSAVVYHRSEDAVTDKEQAESILSSSLRLNTLLKSDILKQGKCTEDQGHVKGSNDQNLLAEAKSGNEDSDEEITVKKSAMEDFKACLLLKEKDIDALRESNKELEYLITNIQSEKCELEGNLATALKESNTNSKSLDDLRHDLMVITRNMESQLATTKMLERKSVELEGSKYELELHVSGLEEENVQLLERLSGLEAQLRYLTNEKESSKLELEDSRSLIMDLKEQITKQQTEWESQTAESKQKLQDIQKRLAEAQEESEFLKRCQSKLQATTESLIEECSSLQKLNGDLKAQKIELYKRTSHLEVELNDSQKKSVDFCNKVEVLEKKLCSLQKDIVLKESLLSSQLESIFQEHREHKEKISEAYIMLNQMEVAKSVEVEHLQTQIEHLTSQLSSTHDERESISSEAVLEVFNLRSEKSKLETSLQEASGKVKLCETELCTLRQESENKIQGLIDLLSTSKQSEEMLMADIDRMQKLMVSVKTSEDKFQRMTNELELKLRASDYEKLQLMEELSSLKVQLQKIEHLQNELLSLRSSLDEAKFERGKMEESLQSISEECEELKAERVSLLEKISNMHKASHDGEEDRRNRIALEEKLLRLEGDLTARHTSYTHEAELKNELNRITRSNSEYKRRIQGLEEEKDELLKKTQDIVLRKEVKDEKISHEDTEERQAGKEDDLNSRVHSLENELARALETSNMYKQQLSSFISEEKQNGDSEALEKNVNGNDARIDYAGRISSLETELKEMEGRYLQMSLQYAQVEAQREELVMQLKSAKQGKKWFS